MTNKLKNHTHYMIKFESWEEECQNIYRCAICDEFFDRKSKKEYEHIYLEFSPQDNSRIIRKIPAWMVE